MPDSEKHPMPSSIIDNRSRGKVANFLKEHIKDSSRLSFVSALDAAYCEMAADSVREKDALEWSNAVVGDCSNEKR